MLIELRQALISYQDYHVCYAHRVETGPYFVPGLPHAVAPLSQAAKLTLLDLVPSTTYYLRLKSYAPGAAAAQRSVLTF